MCVVAAAFPASAVAFDVATTGSWTLNITAADLRSGAGSDLTDTYDSGAGAVTLDVTGAAGSGDPWRVEVRRSDVVWPASVHLWVRRAGAGTGAGAVSGGSSFQEITSSDTVFFSGTGDRASIPLELRVTGVSLRVTSDTYAASVTYTVSAN
jgi:hypothetical protein